MENLRVNTIGITVGEGDSCVLVSIGGAALYLHGTYDEIREFGRHIIACAGAFEEYNAPLALSSVGQKQTAPVEEVAL